MTESDLGDRLDRKYKTFEYYKRWKKHSEAAMQRADSKGEIHEEQTLMTALGDELRNHRHARMIDAGKMAQDLGIHVNAFLSMEDGFMSPHTFFAILPRWSEILGYNYQAFQTQFFKSLQGAHDYRKMRAASHDA